MAPGAMAASLIAAAPMAFIGCTGHRHAVVQAGEDLTGAEGHQDGRRVEPSLMGSQPERCLRRHSAEFGKNSDSP
jgi:hypothetical protein